MAIAKKVKKVKASSNVSTIMDLFTIPCKQEKPLDLCSFVLTGKKHDIPANKVNKLDISKLDTLVDKNVITVLTNLYNAYTLTMGRYTIKNQYGICLGVCDTVNSYKAMLSYHKANNGLIVNGNKHFTFDEAVNLANTFDLNISKGKGNWGLLTVTDKNVNKVEKYAVKLLKMKKK